MTKLIITFWNCFVNAPRKFLRQKRVRHREHNQVTVVVMTTRVTTHTKGRCHCKRCHMRESENLIITAWLLNFRNVSLITVKHFVGTCADVDAVLKAQRNTVEPSTLY